MEAHRQIKEVSLPIFPSLYEVFILPNKKATQRALCLKIAHFYFLYILDASYLKE